MKRNKFKILLLSLFVVSTVAIALTWRLASASGLYSKKLLPTLEPTSANDAIAWLKDRYVDLETGQPITSEKLQIIKNQLKKLAKSKSIIFKELGPDNVGGRTRAILVDRTNNDRLWAGGVSGGLFVSHNRGAFWERVGNFIQASNSPYISGMTQTIDGNIFVATGSIHEEAWGGNGIWYSTDFGDTWSVVPGTLNKICTEVISSDADNYIWYTISGTSGLKKWKIGETAATGINNTAGECKSIQISKDGQVLVGSFGSNRTYISNDGGTTWLPKFSTSSQPNLVSTNGVSRIEYAISTEKINNNYTIYAARTDLNLNGMNVSYDNGNTWQQFVGASGTPSNLDIYRDQGDYNSIITVLPNNPNKILIGGIDIWQWEQTSNNPAIGGFEQISLWSLSPTSSKYVHADNHEMKWDNLNRLYVGNDGGIGITDNYGATWYPSNRGYNVTQFYGIAFDRDGAVMGGAQDNGSVYNDYTLSTDKEFRPVLGGDGFECEISFFNPRVMFASLYNNSISRSGDKGLTWAAFAPDTSGGFPPIYEEFGMPNYPFHTELFLAESYDLQSKDSVMFVCTKNYSAGSKIRIPSLSTGDSMTYTTPVSLHFDDTLYYDPNLTETGTLIVNSINNQNVFLDEFSWVPFPTASQANPPEVGDSILVDFPTGADTVVVGSLSSYPHYFGRNVITGETISMGDDTVTYNVSWDTLIVQDPYQSWFVVYVNKNNGELWATRDALRLSAKTVKWVCIARGIGGPNTGSNQNSNFDIEFSRDLNYCFVLTGSGVTRLSGLRNIYSTDPQFFIKAGYHGGSTLTTPPTNVTAKLLSGTGSCEGLAVNPNNDDDIILFSGFSGSIRRSTNATSDAPTFTPLPSITSPSPACYDGIIIDGGTSTDEDDIIVVGTSEGVFVSENGGGNWSDASAGFEGTPVFEVRHSWRTYNEGNNRPGEIFIGTYGRGIWSTDAYAGLNEYGTKGSSIKTFLKAYPNPTTENTTLTFNLKETSNVTINVYSISGRLVKTIYQKNVDSGAQTMEIDGSDLKQGTYIVKFVAGKQVDTVKFIKM